MRPLTDVARVATDIGGTLHRRLPNDPDLEPLVTSFNGMVTNLQQRIERDERFASDVSHELRSPLSTLRASVDVLGSYKELLTDAGKTSVDTLGFEVDRFSGMVQDLLEMSRIDAGVPDLNVTDLSLDELVVRAVGAHNSKIPVHISPEATGLQTVGDKRCLQRVITNLLDNADIHAGGAVLVSLERHAHLAISAAVPMSVVSFEGGTITDRVAASFTNLTGEDQVAGAAQLVYTLTALPDIHAVSVRIGGHAARMPLPDGRLSTGPLTRAEYASLAPV